ncbi:MAG: hypothetical protein WD512_11550 [Candidatus Paceibacterota bacterium]
MKNRYKILFEKVVKSKGKKKLLLGDKEKDKEITKKLGSNTSSIVINPIYNGPFGYR